MTGRQVVIPAEAKDVIPAKAGIVIPAQAGIQGALGPRLRGDDALRHLRGDDGARGNDGNGP